MGGNARGKNRPNNNFKCYRKGFAFVAYEKKMKKNYTRSGKSVRTGCKT